MMEIWRILAAVGAFFVCTLEGYRRGRALKDRALFLAETEQMLERFAVEIRCSGRSSDELLERENGHFAALVKTCKAEYGDMRKAWEKACEKLPPKLGETALLLELGRSFGSSDKESTLRLIERCASEISALKASAEAEYSKRGKSLFQVGTLCGLSAAVIIV